MTTGNIPQRTDLGQLGRLFCGWTAARSAVYQGWWLLTSLSMVADARLDGRQLLIIAAAQGTASILTEIPAGVVADVYSHKWSLVIFHGLRGAAMITAGLFPAFWPLLVANSLNGVSWTFSSGADVAWLTDEIDDPPRAHRILTASMQATLLGSAAGMLAAGAIATTVGRLETMVGAGVMMLLLGVLVAFAFPEDGFTRTPGRPLRQARTVLRSGWTATRTDPVLLSLLGITVLANGAFDSLGRIYPLRLEQLGFPTSVTGTFWWTVLGVIGLILGAVTIAIVRPRLHTDRGSAAILVAALGSGTASCVLFGISQGLAGGIPATLLFTGISTVLVGNVTTLWVNRRAHAASRATVHSFFGQAEYLGEIGCAAALAVVGLRTGSAFLIAGALLLLAALIAVRAPHRSRM